MRFSYYKRPLFLLLMCWVAGILAFHACNPPRPPAFLEKTPVRAVRLEGRVADYPVYSRGFWRFTLDSYSPLPGHSGGTERYMAYLRDLGGASYGDRAAFTASLARPFNYAVPGNLDWRAYLAGHGIMAEARGGRLEIIQKAPFLIRSAALFRSRALAVFETNFTAERAAVLGGIVLGEKKGASGELKAAFQDSGSMHLLVASGSNVGFVTFVVYFLCSRLKMRKRYSGLLALLCAGFYVLAAGLEAPLVRAYVMFLAALAGYLLDRDSGIFQGLIIACLAILLEEPSALFDAGFQMSFIAAYGITVGMALWDGLMKFKGPPRALCRVLLVSFFAQAGLYPLMALYFHKISLISIISNVLLVPASGVLMGLGFVTLLSSWSGIMFPLVKTLAGFGVGAFIRLVRAFAAFRYSSVLVSPPSAFTMTAFFVFVFVLLHAPLFGFRSRRLYLLGGIGLLAILAGGFLPPGSLVSVFSDSDTHSVMVRHGKDGLFLFNPGISGSKLANSVLYYGRREVECVFVSSPARRDWGGLAELGKLIKIKQAALPYGALPAELKKTAAQLAQAGTLVERVWPGDSVLIRELEVRPGWGSGPGMSRGTAGYTGRDQGEGLDWFLKAPDLEVRVVGGGSIAAIKRGSGAEVVLKNPPGEAAELEL
ncbi:MAG: ComEC/Rec2 family competence protein [Elusimicrobiales bacterium]|jgi:competence protein ComEC